MKVKRNAVNSSDIILEIFGSPSLSTDVDIIYQKRVRVFHQGFQTPRNR